MCWSDAGFASQWPPLNQHGQYIIDPILSASPTGSKDGVTTGKLKRGIFVPAPCCYSHFYPAVFEMFSPCLLQGRYRQGKAETLFPFSNIKTFCLGSPHYQMCLQHVQRPTALEYAQKFDFVTLIHDKWHFTSYVLTEVSRTWSRVCRYWFWILDQNPLLLPDFTVFRNAGHCFNSSKTGCCRCPVLTAAILLMLCSTGCPVLLRFKT